MMKGLAIAVVVSDCSSPLITRFTEARHTGQVLQMLQQIRFAFGL